MASMLDPPAAAATATATTDSHAVSKAVRRLARLVTGCPTEQMAALVKLAHMANESSSSCYAIAAAGGIPLVVDLLVSSNMDVLDLAAGMLGTMAYASPALPAAVAAGGGVERLAQLLGSGHPAVQRLVARGQQYHGGAAVESSDEVVVIQDLCKHCALSAAIQWPFLCRRRGSGAHGRRRCCHHGRWYRVGLLSLEEGRG
jgi:hypothetical protein